MTEYSTLPRDKMRKVRIAFDVDGTLRCNCTPVCKDPNKSIVQLCALLATSFKNVEVYVWSGGGADYARRFAELYKLPVKANHCVSKFNPPDIDIAIDDIQETALGRLCNLIVRCK